MEHIEDLKKIVAAWEKLPEGYHSPKEVERWLVRHMSPVINKFRKKIAESEKMSNNDREIQQGV